jgi:hypothetical protein
MTFRPDPYGSSPGDLPRSVHLEQLILLPSFPDPSPARDRLERALGRDLASFLIAALSGNQGRGASSP